MLARSPRVGLGGLRVVAHSLSLDPTFVLKSSALLQSFSPKDHPTKARSRNGKKIIMRTTYVDVERQMHLGYNLLHATLAFRPSPFRRRTRIRRLSVEVELHMGEVLQKANEEERHLVVCELAKLR